MLEGEGLGQMVQPASKRHCAHKGATSRHRGRLSPTRIKRFQAPQGLRHKRGPRIGHRVDLHLLGWLSRTTTRPLGLPRTRYGEELAPSARGGVTSSKESIKEAGTEFGPLDPRNFGAWLQSV